MENKTIYMTYKKNIPEFVIDRWRELNPDYKIDFSLDEDCINFLDKHFGPSVVYIFNSLQKGMYKADLWRLCKLYINGGVYADVDLVPYLNIDELDKNITFYSCLGGGKNTHSIFQAFIVSLKPKNKLILVSLLSLLNSIVNKKRTEPCFDIYRCIQYNMKSSLQPYTKYNVSQPILRIHIGKSATGCKNINLLYFPNDVEYKVILANNNTSQKFIFDIKYNILTIKRIDKPIGWDNNHSVIIIFNASESVYLFKEQYQEGEPLETAWVSNKNVKILDSRDAKYSINGGW